MRNLIKVLLCPEADNDPPVLFNKAKTTCQHSHFLEGVSSPTHEVTKTKNGAVRIVILIIRTIFKICAIPSIQDIRPRKAEVWKKESQDPVTDYHIQYHTCFQITLSEGGAMTNYFLNIISYKHNS